MPNLRGAWLNELRDDVVNATLVAILQNNGVALDRRTVAAACRRVRVAISLAAQDD